jgi:V/A-type H+-transporting ATPase subunit C
MLTHFSSNAILTKTKAMYSGHLTKNQYQEMMHKQSVSEIAAYLRDETQYEDVLKEINPGTIHRGQLESLLRESIFLQYGKLMRYDTSYGKDYFHYVISEIEIIQILMMIRLLNMGTPEQYVLQYQQFVERYINFRMSQMAKARSFDDMLDVLKDTPYAEQLAGLRPKPGEPIDYTQCENALFTRYYAEIEKVVNRRFRGATRKQLNEIFKTQVELTNIRNLYRLKKFFPNTPRDVLIRSCIPAWQHVPASDLKDLIDAKDVDSFILAVMRSRYAKYFEPGDFDFVEYRMKTVQYRLAKHLLHFADNAPVAFTAYRVLCVIELENIISVIEGVRYRSAPVKIQKILVF